jgi:intracellular sulfur oxidation DsrE/DsrF family protein
MSYSRKADRAGGASAIFTGEKCMRQIMTSIAVVAVLVTGSMLAAAAGAPEEATTTPAIEGYGKIYPVPHAAYKPDPHQSYKVVFALTTAAKAPNEVNPSLERVARSVNLYVSSGVPLSHLKFVGIAYGAATPLALNDAQYQAAYGMPNPNLKLIALLRKAGVDIAVCGQAVAEHKYQFDWVDSTVTLALSGLTTVTTLEQQGYSLMPL